MIKNNFFFIFIICFGCFAVLIKQEKEKNVCIKFIKSLACTHVARCYLNRYFSFCVPSSMRWVFSCLTKVENHVVLNLFIVSSFINNEKRGYVQSYYMLTIKYFS